LSLAVAQVTTDISTQILLLAVAAVLAVCFLGLLQFAPVYPLAPWLALVVRIPMFKTRPPEVLIVL
jgi:hypothetical protein